MSNARFEATVQLAGPGFLDEEMLVIDASPDASVCDLVDALQSRRPGCGGTLTIWGGRAQLPSAELLHSLQLTHGQRLGATAKSNAPPAPVLHDTDVFRIVVEEGPQSGTAWPVRRGGPLFIRLDQDGYWSSCDDATAHIRLDLDQDLVKCSRGADLPSDWILKADRAFTSESFVTGSLLRVEQWAQDPPANDPDTASTDARTLGSLRVVSRTDHDDQRHRFGVVPFRIRPRRSNSALLPPKKLTLPPHPTDEPPKLDLTNALVQLIPTVGIVLVMSFATSFRWYYMLIPLLQALTIGFIQVRQAEAAKAAFRKRREVWLAETIEVSGSLRSQVEREARAIEERNATLALLVRDAIFRCGDLWRRSQEDDDFLVVSVGKGEYQSLSHIELPQQLPLQTREKWRLTFESETRAQNTPVELNLSRQHIALVGAEEHVRLLATHVLLDLLLSHSPSRLTLVALLPTSGARNYLWLRDWPHLAHKQSAWLFERFRVGQKSVRNAIRENRQAGTQIAALNEHVVIFVDERSGPPVSDLKLISESSDGYVHIIWLGRGWGSIPDFIGDRWVEVDQTSAVIRPGKPQRARLTGPPGRELIYEVSSAIRPVMDEVGAGRSVSSIPDEVAIGQLIDLDDQASLWASNSSSELRIAFLVNEHGLVEFDLVDLGPHILVGGMTGSGKSEFLRALLCSAVTRYSPDELAILLVDFKGGASLKVFKDAPHCIGSVTNLSDVDVDRLLAFLEAELRRREALFQPHSGEYKDFRKAGDAKDSPPRLLVVFDEFASFVAENSRREAAIVTLAQKGRSVGVHLVLATQSPGTAVTQPIRDNVGARFALKTADAASSERIIERSDAAGIAPSAKGRLFARLMDGMVYQYQCAHTRGYVFKDRSSVAKVSIRSRARTLGTGPSRNHADADLAVLLDAVKGKALAVRAAKGAESVCPRNQPRLLPSLSELPPKEFELPDERSRNRLLIGKADLPRSQAQPVEEWDWGSVSVLVSGPAGCGKSSFMRMCLSQFVDSESPGFVTVIDPTTKDPSGWRASLGTSKATWIVAGETTDAVVQLIEQLEALMISPVRGQRVLVLLDRLDLIAHQLEPDLVVRLARLVSGSYRSGIFFVCSSDSRTPIDRGLKGAFAVHYRFTGEESRLLTREDLEYLVRPFVLKSSSQARRSLNDSIALPLGHAITRTYDPSPETGFVDDGRVCLGLDDLTHQPIDIPLSDTLVVTGASPRQRQAVLRWFAGQLEMRGLSLGAIGSQDEVSGLSDVIAELTECYSDLQGETPAEKTISLLSRYDHVAIFECDSLLRTLRQRLRAESRADAAPMIYDAIRGRLGASDLPVVMHCTFRLPPFQDPYWKNVHIQVASWVYLDPKPETLIPGSGGGSLEKALIAARPHRLYGQSDAVCLVEGVRHELTGLRSGVPKQ